MDGAHGHGNPGFGSLRDFIALKRLDVSGLVLFGDPVDLENTKPSLASIPPPSLKSLSINMEWDDDIEDALHSLLSDVSAYLPNLKLIECAWRPLPRVFGEYLVEAFAEKQVVLVLSLEE